MTGHAPNQPASAEHRGALGDARSPAAEELRARLESGQACVAVVGLGYVGLPLVRALHDAGYRVVGYDIDETKIEKLRRGECYIEHLGPGFFGELARSQRFVPTADPSRLGEADAILLCVPTPLGRHREPDLSYVLDSARLCAATLRRGQLIVLESTTYPGTTREEMLPILERSGADRGLRCGAEYFVAYSPEREDPGSPGRTARELPKVVGGVDAISGDLAAALYGRFVRSVIRVSSAEVAESSKLLENIYRAVNIALVNELKVVLGAMGIDVWEVIEAAATKPFGFQAFYPGPGLGGHCIPIDPFYLTWKAKAAGHSTRFIELAGEINSAMPHHVVDRLAAALNDDGRAVRGARILVLGIAYKKNVDDIRESPAAEIVEMLRDRGADVAYHDPHLPHFPSMRRHRIDLRSQPLSPELLGDCDAVFIVTDHDAVDYDLVGAHARLVVDTRNAMARVAGPVKARLVKA
ncbi:MAG TPA: nucleotide sugar dehydrogenase [Phycisphaerales bacterium]|nr:nucleotide sugar dehydrogenase [Phycisphaerales bacterium]HMP37213.1 nucleotide sugar dehydrogenase [Phycisphaerales bacterium]